MNDDRNIPATEMKRANPDKPAENCWLIEHDAY
jgi:hypothetical protein